MRVRAAVHRLFPSLRFSVPLRTQLRILDRGDSCHWNLAWRCCCGPDVCCDVDGAPCMLLSIQVVLQLSAETMLPGGVLCYPAADFSVM